METAWMVRKDGKIIPVVQHIYANPNCVEETLYAAEWLYNNTEDEEIKDLIMEFIRAWAMQYREKVAENISEMIYQEIEQRPYVFLTKSFIEEHKEDFFPDWSEDLSEQVLKKYCHKITLALNEEFMRVRYGGKYHTHPGNRELYFRISSEHVCWTDVINMFRKKMKLDYKMMKVVIDEESAEVNPNILETNKKWLTIAR